MPLKPGDDVTALMAGVASGDDVTALMGGAEPPPMPFTRRGGMTDPAMATPEVFKSRNEFDAQGNPVVRPDEGSGVLGFASHVGQQINPLTMARAVGQAVAHPIDTVQGIGAAQGALFDKAKSSYDQGDYSTAARHFVNYLLPMIGPALDKSADEMQQGQYAAGAGDAVGIGLALFGPQKLGELGAARYPLAANPTPPAPAPTELQAAVRAGQAAGIPVDVATATGNDFLRGAQRLSGKSLGGSVVAQKAAEAQRQAMGTWGEELAGTVRETAITPEQAGQGVRDLLSGKRQAHTTAADAAYDRLRALEAGRVTSEERGFPVDLRPAKKVLQPLYAQMQRQMPITQQQASPGLKAIQNILDSPDTGPLSQIDRDLSAIKAVARQQGGLAKEAARVLDTAVRTAAANGGPDVVRLLDEGRQAVRAGVATEDVLTALPGGKFEQPMPVFQLATAPNNAGIEMLRAVHRETPAAVPQLARAKLEDLMGMLPDKAAAEWGKLKPETRAILFPKVGQAQALDQFFSLGKRLAENPNRSGSGFAVAQLAELAAYSQAPLAAAGYSLSMTGLAQLLHSPATVSALNRLMRVSVQPSATAAERAVAVANLAKLAHQAGVPLERHQSTEATP